MLGVVNKHTALADHFKAVSLDHNRGAFIDPDSVTVSANAQVPTTIGALFRDKLPVNVSATASRGKPVRVVDISVTNFNAEAEGLKSDDIVAHLTKTIPVAEDIHAA